MALRHPFHISLPAVLLISALYLSACSDAPSADKPTASISQQDSTPTSDPRPTPASSKGPARNIPKPVLPEIANQNTEEGFAAFTQYWFDAVTYGYETRDSAPLEEVSAENCKMCASYVKTVKKLRSAGGWGVGPRWAVSGFQTDFVKDPAGRQLGNFLLDESPSTLYSADGNVTNHLEGERVEGAQAVHAVFSDGRWELIEAGGA